jgi:glycogen debranching enzyme
LRPAIVKNETLLQRASRVAGTASIVACSSAASQRQGRNRRVISPVVPGSGDGATLRVLGGASHAAVLDALLSEEGWAYASTAPVEPGDLGRFHALFGRDSLICALQVLPARPDVARATLRALAARQGRRKDPEIEEEPGKIGHEFRDAAPAEFVAGGYAPVRDGQFRYYATSDATSWFLVVLERLGDARLAAELEPARRRAAAWLEHALAGGGGFVRHATEHPRGALTQTGWRDTGTGANGGGIAAPDGSLAPSPLADADCQAVAYAALRSLARLTGDAVWDARAGELAGRVCAAFGPDVMALGGDGTPVSGAGSQLGWLLWSGVLDADPSAAAAVADRVCEPDVLTPWGLRTLSSEHPAFDAHAYHRGSVWPFDCWLGWGGLRGAGRADAAERVRAGVLAALERLGRAPELYAVTRSGELESSPLANRVQAWSVGARWALEQGWDGRVSRP